MRAQSSVEYIFIVAFALMIVIPGAFVFSQYSSASQSSLRNAQLYKVGSDLIDASELMFSVGENSWQTVDITLPNDVVSMTVYDGADGINELVIEYEDLYISQAVFFTEVPLKNSTSNEAFIQDCTNGCSIPIHDGKNSIRVESLRNSIVVLRVIR